jgi:hypothetical protein
MVGPKKQGFCPKINMLKVNFDTNYFEPLMILSRVSTILEILEILKGQFISLKFWLKIFGKLVSDLL